MSVTFDVVIPATGKPVVNRTVQHLSALEVGIGTIVIVDFDPSEPSLQPALVFGDTQIQTVFVTCQRFFNKSIAINVGFHFTRSSVIVMCDADVLLEASFFQEAARHYLCQPDSRKAFSPCFVQESVCGTRRPAPGIVALNRQHYLAVEGYCSEFIGWGMEDMDFLRRLRAADILLENISSGIHLSHPDTDRVRNYDLRSVDEMRVRNRRLYEQQVQLGQRYGTLTRDIHHVLGEGLSYDDKIYC